MTSLLLAGASVLRSLLIKRELSDILKSAMLQSTIFGYFFSTTWSERSLFSDRTTQLHCAVLIYRVLVAIFSTTTSVLSRVILLLWGVLTFFFPSLSSTMLLCGVYKDEISVSCGPALCSSVQSASSAGQHSML